MIIENCINCKICVGVCSAGCIKFAYTGSGEVLEFQNAIIYLDDCICCGYCVEWCPIDAIDLSESCNIFNENDDKDKDNGDNKWGDNSNNGDKYSVDNAVNWLNNNAHSSWKDSKGQCAKYIRWSLESGLGLKKDAFLGKAPVAARSYGPFLESQGFQSVNTSNYLKGDIAVIQGYEGGTSDANGVPYGHIQMYNGNIWISDFKQHRPFWPSGKYELYKPSFVIYRRSN